MLRNVLTDEQLRDIQAACQQQTLDPQSEAWMSLLLEERRELLGQLAYVRQRVQAAIYIEGLCVLKEQPASGRDRPPRGERRR
jgi:hypothetical protein